MSSNPSEAKNMLLQNPQLAYALLQVNLLCRSESGATAETQNAPNVELKKPFKSLDDKRI